MNHLDFSTIQRLDKSFITDDFKEKESDLIYKISFKGQELYIYLLIEFQSTVDKFMAIRMLRYICEFYEFLIQKKIKRLPPVFPMLLYNGDAKWTAKSNIKDLIIHSIPCKYIPKFEFYPVIVNKFSKEFLLTLQNAVSAIFYVENSDVNELKENFDKIVNLLKSEQSEIITLFREWINNFLGYIDKSVNDTIFDLEEEKAMFSTALKRHDDNIKNEAMQKGIQKGEEMGEKNKAIKTAKKMLSLNYPIDDIVVITGLKREDIEKLK